MSWRFSHLESRDSSVGIATHCGSFHGVWLVDTVFFWTLSVVWFVKRLCFRSRFCFLLQVRGFLNLRTETESAFEISCFQKLYSTQSPKEDCVNEQLRARESGYWIPIGVRYSAIVQAGPGAYTVCYTVGTESLFREWSSWGLAFVTYALLAPRLRKGKTTAVLPVRAFISCSRANFAFMSHLLLTFCLPLWY
jgi:hypothetical protein